MREDFRARLIEVAGECEHFQKLDGRCWLEGWRTFPDEVCTKFERPKVSNHSPGKMGG